jgi:hypothetical protein
MCIAKNLRFDVRGSGIRIKWEVRTQPPICALPKKAKVSRVKSKYRPARSWRFTTLLHRITAPQQCLRLSPCYELVHLSFKLHALPCWRQTKAATASWSVMLKFLMGQKPWSWFGMRVLGWRRFTEPSSNHSFIAGEPPCAYGLDRSFPRGHFTWAKPRVFPKFKSDHREEASRWRGDPEYWSDRPNRGRQLFFIESWLNTIDQSPLSRRMKIVVPSTLGTYTAGVVYARKISGRKRAI